MATARDLNYKIASLTNMQKVMNAMNMIAATKFRKLLTRLPSLERFREAVDVVRENIVAGMDSAESPLCREPDQISRLHVIVITADKGLCGSHNSNVLKALARIFKSESKKGIDIDVTCIGTRAKNLCHRQGFKTCLEIDSNEKHISDQALRDMSAEVVSRVSRGETDKVIILHNHFISTLQQETKQIQVFPLSADSAHSHAYSDQNRQLLKIATEPEPADFLIPAADLYLFYTLKIALTDSYLSEHAARMTAMENAKTNAEELIKRYVKIRNRARQSTITKELIEIVAGTEAL